MTPDQLRERARVFRAAGLCGACGAAAEPGRRLCDEHLAYQRAYRKRTTAERRAAGLCVQCGAPSAPGRAYCEPHRIAINAASADSTRRRKEREKRRQARRERDRAARASNPGPVRAARQRFVQRRRAAGLCVKCGAPSGGKYVCGDCTDDIVADRTEVFGERRAAGLCRCGRCPRPGRSSCAKCSEERRVSAQRRRERMRSAGGCVQCGGTLAPTSRRFCIAHLAAHRETVARLRRRKRGDVIKGTVTIARRKGQGK